MEHQFSNFLDMFPLLNLFTPQNEAKTCLKFCTSKLSVILSLNVLGQRFVSLLLNNNFYYLYFLPIGSKTEIFFSCVRGE